MAAVTVVLTFQARPAAALDTVTLQLKHRHQFQFAGYYAALEKGFYREAGLDVVIREGSARGDAERAVVTGQAEFGVGASNLLLARLAGRPVVVLGVVFQHSPYVLLVRSQGGAHDLKNVRGKRVMLGSLTDEMGQADELIAYLKKEGVPTSSFVRVEHSYDPEDLIEGKVDAMSAYVTNEPDVLDRAGFMVNRLSP